MAVALVNLTLLKVTEELETLLETYPYLEYHHNLKNPELREKLLAYVLSRIPNHHVAIDVDQYPLAERKILSGTTEERMKIEELIYRGIMALTCPEQYPQTVRGVSFFNPVYSRC